MKVNFLQFMLASCLFLVPFFPLYKGLVFIRFRKKTYNKIMYSLPKHGLEQPNGIYIDLLSTIPTLIKFLRFLELFFFINKVNPRLG